MSAKPACNFRTCFWRFLTLNGLFFAISAPGAPPPVPPNPYLLPSFSPASRLEALSPPFTHGGDPRQPETLRFTSRLAEDRGGAAGLGTNRQLSAAFYWGGRPYPAQTRIQARGSEVQIWLSPAPLPGSGNGQLVVKLTGSGLGDGQSVVAGIRFDGQSLDVLFLVDNSGSMSENDPGQERFLALGRSLSAAPVRQAAVMMFSDKCFWAMPWRPASPPGPWVEAAKAWAVNTKPGGQTEMADAFRMARQALVEHRTGARKALVFLTDGVASSPVGGEADELAALGIPVCTVGLHRPGQADYDGAFLARLAERTGGLFLDGPHNDLGRVYRSLLDHLRPGQNPWFLSPPPARLRNGMAPVISWVETSPGAVVASFTQDGAEWPVLAQGRSGRLQEAALNPPPPGFHRGSVRLSWAGGFVERPWDFRVDGGPAFIETDGPTQVRGPVSVPLRVFMRLRLNAPAAVQLEPLLDIPGRIPLSPDPVGTLPWQMLAEGLRLEPGAWGALSLVAPPAADNDSRLLLLREGGEAFPLLLTRSPGPSPKGGEVHIRVVAPPPHRLKYLLFGAVLALACFLFTWAIPQRPHRRPTETS